MAILRKGIYGMVTGKIGNTYYFVRNGKQELRAARHNSEKPRSVGQLATEQRMAIMCPVLSVLKMYVRVGFELAARINNNLPVQSARSYNLKYAIKGVYPDQEVDYPALRLSEGKLSVPLNPAVEVTATGFRFTWDCDLTDENGSPYDRTMLIAWFPDRELYFQIIDGAIRQNGADFLPISDMVKGMYAETYFSFVTDDRSQISNSVYTGRIEF